MRDDLRAAVELALAVGRADNDADPPVPPPPALRPLFSFAKLPTAARKTAAQVIDSDEPFRARVAAKATERTVGRIGWLWLHRPAGWETEIEDLRDTVRAEQHRRDEDRDEQRATRRLGKMEERIERAERELATARSELTDERATSATLRAERDEATRLVEQFRSETTQSADERRRMLGQLKAAEARAAALLGEKRAADATVAALTHDLHEARASAEFGAAVGAGPDATTPDRSAADLAASNLAAMGRELTAAAEMARELAASLDETRASIEPARGRSGDRTARSAADTSSRSKRRRPESLPVGVFDDSLEAAEHLVRVPNMVALVDGYNVSIGAWPHLTIADQRRRLIDGLDALSARTRLEVELVFDGVREPDDIVGRRGPQLLRVTYTEAGIEADDLILDRIAAHPVTRPIVVVSSDRRVGDGSRERGANVLASAVLAELISGPQ